MLFDRLVLSLGAVMFGGFGVLLLLWPEKLSEWANIGATTAGGRTELRAFYGGLELGLAALLVLGAVRPRMAPAALAALAAVSIGTAFGRTVGFFADDSFQTTMLLYLVIELAFGGLALAGCLRHSPPGSS